MVLSAAELSFFFCLLAAATASGAPSAGDAHLVNPTRLQTCDLTGRWTGDASGASGPLIVINQTGTSFTASAPGYWDATTTGGIAVGTLSADGVTIRGYGGWTHDKTTEWTLKVSRLQPDDPQCSKIETVDTATGKTVAAWCNHALVPTRCGVPELPPFDGCANQLAVGLVTPEKFGQVYRSATNVAVSFDTSDTSLQAVYDHAVSCEAANTKEFLPGLDCIVEGSNYKNVWLETQPMAGAMWAVRNVTRALANQLVFMRTQRDDGRLPGMVTTNNGATAKNPVLNAVYCIGHESLLQGDYFSSTSVDIGFFLNISDEDTATKYTSELHGVLERFDNWMWSNRRSSLPGKSDVLWCPSAADWGGDGYDGYDGHPRPILSMDMMAYAHSNALALSRTSKLLGNASGAVHWIQRAQAIATSLQRVLWVEEKGACYDIDANDQVIDVLVHNNLRAMWHGVFSQQMADTFVARHLRNSSEFWTPFPLPSIAANDPKFLRGLPRNSWSGPSEGLTYQRAIRALENYGYHAEITLLGAKLLDAVEQTPGYRFPQQWNPVAYNGTPAAAAGPGDCYGPALLSVLEYNTYARGIKPRPADGVLLWSDAAIAGRQPATATFTQTLGNHVFTLVAKELEFSGSCDGKQLFTATRGVRVLTAPNNNSIIGVVGISSTSIDLKLSVNGKVTTGHVVPNSEYELDAKGGLKLSRQVPFIPVKADDETMPSASGLKSDPVADASAMVTSGCARFSLLTERLVRMEYSASGKFDDRASFAVINRKLRVPEFHVAKNGSTTIITTDALQLSHQGSNKNCGNGFLAGEVQVRLLVAPYSTWISGHSSPPDMRPSSVARIMPDAANLNGTMNHGPSFEGGLDCYSHPPDCVQQYYQIWGQGLVSRNGFVIVNDTNATRLAPAPPPGSSSFQWFDPASTRVSNHIDKDDLYLLVSGLDYTRALGEWASVGGAPSLPPLSALGNWYSRYYPYSEETYEGTIIENYSHYGIPLSVGVLDVPWHNINYAISDLGPDKQGAAPPGRGCNGWDGFTFNRTLFPNPKRFFDKVHSEGIKMILSVHMQNGIDHCQEQYPAMAKAMGYSEARIAANWTINCTMDNVSYVENFFKYIVNSAPIKGTADYWWLDYPGGASEISGWAQQEAASLQWSNRMFAEHKRSMGERPVILARYGGLGQQRDGLGFSGDTFQSYGTLEFQAVMTPTSSNVLFGWWSHDIGGNHNGGYSGYEPVPGTVPKLYPGDENPNNSTGSEMLLRWLQFGCFSPILRTHCEPACDRYIWTFYEHFDAMRATMRLRDALVPYIYTAGVHAFRTGVSLLRPMYYTWPALDDAYSHPSQYMFGEEILVSPVVSAGDNTSRLATKTVWLPKLPKGAGWVNFIDGHPANTSKTQWEATEIPAFVKPGTIVPMRTMNSTYTAFSDPLIWVVWVPTPVPDVSSRFELYEDAGDGREYEDPNNTAHATTGAALTARRKLIAFEVEASRGRYLGQGTSRQHLVQLRGLDGDQVDTVKIDGTTVAKSSAGAVGDGWYVAAQSANGKDNFTQPAGSVVVLVGRREISSGVTVEVKLA